MARSDRIRIYRLLLLFVIFAGVLVSWSEAAAENISDVSSDDEGVDSDGLVQRNPEYVGPSVDADSDDSGDDDSASDGGHDSDNEYDDNEEDGRAAANKALSKSRKGAARSVKLVKKHRTSIMIALAMFAFRREIFMLVSSLLTAPTPDGRRRMRPMSTTSILKILLFVDFMRKIQSPGGDEQTSSPIGALLGGPKGILGHLFKDLLRPTNPAYIPPIEQHYTFERINERYLKDSLAFIKALNPPRKSPAQEKNTFGFCSGGRNSTMAATNLMRRTDGADSTEYNSTAIVLDMTSLDTTVSRMQAMRDEISFLLSHHREMMNIAQNLGANMTNISDTDQSDLIPSIEIIVLLESPGGSASDYGLAAQHIGRLRDEPGIKLTICVDKVAASGGYMMACMSSPGQLYAAPFAVLGSIGVIGQAINIHSTLQAWGVKPLVFRGGKDKAPVGMIGEVTKEGMAKVQGMVDKTHNAFKRHVVSARPIVANHIDEVATGDVWLGADALEVGLVDRLITSDEYIGERILEGARVLKLMKHERKIHFPFGAPGRHPLGLRSIISDARRIMSKVVTVLDDLPDGTGDISKVASARAYGVKTVGTKHTC